MHNVEILFVWSSAGVFGFTPEYWVIFQVLTAASMKMAVFWVVELFFLVNTD
jgi:hypothetical protein